MCVTIGMKRGGISTVVSIMNCFGFLSIYIYLSRYGYGYGYVPQIGYSDSMVLKILGFGDE